MSERTAAQAIRRAIVEVYAELARLGLNTGSTGNISVRCGPGMLITPTGCTVETLRPRDIVLADLRGRSKSSLKPSSEWTMHAEIYLRVGEAHAVVHTHADCCVALSSMRKPVPAFHYMVHSFGGNDVPCVGYRPFGSHDLGVAAAKALERRTACLLANHGMMSRGPTLRAAFDAAIRLEAMARQYLMVLSVGRPTLLSGRQMAVVAQLFEGYGRQPRSGRAPRWSVP